MNRRVYRICLVMVIMIAIVSGIFYYRFAVNQKQEPDGGTLVWQKTTGCDVA